MKKFFVFFVFLSFINCLTAQDWQWVNPVPQGNKLSCVKFVNENIGYAVGDCGSILKTINGGTTWIVQNSGTENHLYSVFFTDADHGYAVGYNGIILKNTVLSIYNLAGQRVFTCPVTDQKIRLELAHLIQGLYIVKCQNDAAIEVGKFIKN